MTLLESLPDDALALARANLVTEVGFGAGPGFVAGKIEEYAEPVEIEVALAWLETYRGVLRAGHVRLGDGTILWFERHDGYARKEMGRRDKPRPGITVPTGRGKAPT